MIHTFLDLLDSDRYYLYGSWSFHQQAKLWKTFFNCFETSRWLITLKTDVNVPTVRKKQEKNNFLLVSWKPQKKRAGSISLSTSESVESKDPNPDPSQNVTDPELQVRVVQKWKQHLFNSKDLFHSIINFMEPVLEHVSTSWYRNVPNIHLVETPDRGCTVDAIPHRGHMPK
jgi:hypothetical protein